jgi:hypothetical protein
MTLDVCLLIFPPVTRSAPGRVNSQEMAFGEMRMEATHRREQFSS